MPPTISADNFDYARIRKEKRALRRALSPELRAKYSAAACKLALDFIPQNQAIALFLSLPEEIDTQPLIAALWQRGQEVLLPVVSNKNSQLAWRIYRKNAPLIKDQMGMLAPTGENLAMPDFVLAPLVAFDAQGTRIGMGGGYYDRSFSGKKRFSPPIFCAYSYSFQYHPEIIPRQNWDIPLDCLINEKEILLFS